MLKRGISSLCFALCFSLFLGVLTAHAGQFLDAPQYAVGSNPQSVATGDFNGDGKIDVAVVNSGSNSVTVLLGNGDGTFTTKATLTTGSSPYGIAVGDFGNGQLDLAVTDSGTGKVSIFLGNGDGTFGAKTDFAVGTTPQGIAVGDVNGDGKLDLVVANSGDNKVGVLMGNGSGGFGAQTAYNTGFNPIAVVLANFHNKIGTDDILDIAVANKTSSNPVSVLLNSGTGTFATPLPVATNGIATSLAFGDFNGDGYNDLAVSNLPVAPATEGFVSVSLSSQVAGGFLPAVPYTIGSSPGLSSSPTGVAVGNFTNSGNLDIVVTAGNDNTLNLLTNTGTNGNFNSEVKYGTGATPYSAVVGDFNGDGKSDVLVANFGQASISVLLNTNNTSLQSRVDYPAGPNVNAVVVGDFNNDGAPDLVFADGDCSGCSANSISIILGHTTAGVSDGTFKAPATYPTASSGTANTYALASGDFNNDGNLDIAAVNNNTGNVSVLLGNGDGTFQSFVSYNVGTQPVAIVVGDFNNDGNKDLAVVNNGSKNVSILLGDGHGNFSAASGSPYTVGNGPFAIVRGNFHGGSKVDLAVVNQTDKTVTILAGNGDGTFTAETPVATGLSNPNSLAVGAFDNTGNLDLAVGDSGTPTVSILLGAGNGLFAAAVPYATGANVTSLTAADFNGDGFTDLAITTKTGSSMNQVSLLPGTGTGTFGTASLFPSGAQATPQAQSIAFGDFNNDGALDLAVANGLSSTVSVFLNTVGTTMGLNSSAVNPSYGAPLTFTATIAPSVTGDIALSGTVTFKSGSTVIAGPITISGGAATTNPVILPVGSNNISAVYSGNYPAHTVSATQSVSQAGSTTTLPTLSPANMGQSVTFTATVCPGAGCPPTGAAPTGTVTFLDGAATLGTGTLSAGVATFSTSSLAAGSHSITASYGGDPNYIGSVSGAQPQVIAGPGFTLGAQALSPGSVSAGTSSTSKVTITATGGFDPTKVTLSCAITPTQSQGPACSFGSISPSGAVTLTVTTTAPTTAMNQSHSGLFYAMFLLPAFGMFLLPKQQRGKLMMFGAVLLISAGCIFQSACGGSPNNGGSGGGGKTGGTPSGQYSITVSGSATGVTTQTATPALTLTVQ